MAKNITFAGQSLQNDNWRTKNIEYRNMPNKIIDLRPLSRRDGFRVVNTYYDSKEITISGVLNQSSEAALKTTLDTMKEYLNKDEQNLDIDDGSTLVRYSATMSQFNVPEEHYHITQIPYQIVFKCQPLGQSQTASTLTASFTASTYSSSFNPIGSGSPKPTLKWEITDSASSPITGITFSNSTTGESITITGLTMDAVGSYIEIDNDDMSVTYYDAVSSSEIDFTGIFPSFETNTNSYSVTITGGGNFELLQTIEYYPLYL